MFNISEESTTAISAPYNLELHRTAAILDSATSSLLCVLQFKLLAPELFFFNFSAPCI
jgi:hypothetical protein